MLPLESPEPPELSELLDPLEFCEDELCELAGVVDELDELLLDELLLDEVSDELDGQKLDMELNDDMATFPDEPASHP